MEAKQRAAAKDRPKEPTPRGARELDAQAANRRTLFAFDREVQDLLLELDDVVSTLPDWVKRR